jgi:hypothetical protein
VVASDDSTKESEEISDIDAVSVIVTNVGGCTWWALAHTSFVKCMIISATASMSSSLVAGVAP